MSIVFSKDGYVKYSKDTAKRLVESSDNDEEYNEYVRLCETHNDDLDRRGLKEVEVDIYEEAIAAGAVDVSSLNPKELFSTGSVSSYLDSVRDEVNENFLEAEDSLYHLLSIEQGIFLESVNPESLTETQYDTREKLLIGSNRYQIREVAVD